MPFVMMSNQAQIKIKFLIKLTIEVFSVLNLYNVTWLKQVFWTGLYLSLNSYFQLCLCYLQLK